MRLTWAGIKNFRSVESAALDECGDLNVLIGKNNSGKSNMLGAIQTFFSFLARERIAVQNPRLALTDWFSQNNKDQITIAVRLRLDEGEAQSLRESIDAGAPQMRNVLAEIPDNSDVYCCLTFPHSDRPFMGYISEISYIERSKNGDTPNHHQIFAISEKAAREIAKRAVQASRLDATIQELEVVMRRFDSDDWRILKDQDTRRTGASPRRLSLGDISPGAIRIVREAVDASDTFHQFQRMVRDEQDGFRSQVKLSNSEKNETPFETFSGQAHSVPDYVVHFIGLVSSLKVHSLSETRAPIGETEAAEILRLKMSRGQSEKLRDLQEIVRSLLGVEIDAFASDTPRRGATTRQPEIPAEIDVDDFLVQINGSGIRQSLRLVLDYEFQRPDILLIEEPEVYLHPGLEIALLQYLKSISSRCQIFLTTHSTNFLDTAELKNVYLVTRNESTDVQLLHMEDAEDAIPEELGIRLSSLFMYDRLVFVEGPTDEQVIREFAKKLGINLAQAGVGFVSTGGARNFTHYATANTLSFLSRRRVKVFFVIDRDERDHTDIAKLERMLEQLGSLQVLERRELENYLIAPKALISLIISRRAGGIEELPSAIEMSQVIEKACDDMKENVIARHVSAKICRPIIPNRDDILEDGGSNLVASAKSALDKAIASVNQIAESLDEIVSETRETIERDWRSKKLELTPGDELIRTVLKNYDVNFKKSRDGLLLAQLMNEGDLAQEIKDLLRKFVQ